MARKKRIQRQKKDNRLYYFIFSVFVLLAVYIYVLTDTEVPESIDKDCVISCAEQNIRCKETCSNNEYFSLALQDSSYCDKISGGDMRIGCWNNIYRIEAVKNQDISACDQISNFRVVENCKDAIYQEEARESGDLEKCSKIIDTNRKTQCTEHILIKTAISANDITLCNKVGESCRNAFYQRQAYIERDDQICNLITDAQMKQNCIDSFIQGSAIELEDELICEQMVNPVKINKCKSVILEEEPEIPVSAYDQCSQGCRTTNRICEETC